MNPSFPLCVLLFSTSIVFGQSGPGASTADAPAPLMPVPNENQLRWQELEFYAFVHFGINTFTDVEWGSGREDPDSFQPSALDCRQWARVCRDAGMKGIILTAKHHDGFCLWPSQYTDHTVAQSSWRDGKGDVVGELAAACREYGLKLGLYLSPWDRNHPDYGNSAVYNQHFQNQLREILSSYGDVFEVWFDGACGEGPNGKKQVYDWPGFVSVVREQQPEAVIFHGGLPDVRWCGNERGYSNETCWSLFRMDEFVCGEGEQPAELNRGHENGTQWLPSECDVSIRPGWFYHPEEDEQVKTLEQLMDIYVASVGRNSSLLLNLPVDRRGLVHENDAARLLELGELIRATFDDDLAAGQDATSPNVRGDDLRYGPRNVIDGDPQTFWAAAENERKPALEVVLANAQVIDHVVLEEPIELGQRVRSFRVDAHVGGQWQPIAEGTTIGNRRILRVPPTRCDRVRVEILDAKAAPLLRRVALFRGPPRVAIASGQAAFLDSTRVALSSDTPGAEIRYTVDGTMPKRDSLLYEGPIALTSSCTLTALAFYEDEPGAIPASMDFQRYSKDSLLPATHFFRAPDAGLRYSYYEANWQTLDALATTDAVETGVVREISLAPRKRDAHIGFAFEGWIQVPAEGLYQFHCSSDDGSRLWIGGQLVADNDGLHGTQTVSGWVGLQAGFHALRLEYFNAVGGSSLGVEVEGPGVERSALSKEWLFQ